ncbi:hypothetical protein PV392_09600 [Streptomyces sp. ME03-5709C]|nr:hypothetical protein [Streptomyces sp. ME03-5709C]
MTHLTGSTARVVGRYHLDKGLRYLVADRGWIALDGDVRHAVRPGSLALVRGVWTSGTRIAVEAIEPAGPNGDLAGHKAHFHVDPATGPRFASGMRGRVHSWARERDFTEIVFPTVWGRSEEYGVEEFGLTHSQLDPGADLKLLQSPEYVIWAAMAEGLDSCFTFARCYRHEDVPPPDRIGDYLTEFEQLVFVRSATDLNEMVDLAQDLVLDLCSAAGLKVDPSDFRRVSPRGLGGSELPGPAGLESFRLFSVPADWSVKARDVLRTRLLALGASVHSLDAGDVLGSPGQATRWIIDPREAAAQVERVLSVATAYAEDADRTDAQALQWNATWNIAPPREWRDGEEHDSTHEVRSINSGVLRSDDGEVCITDAELYLAGREVVHVRQYADAEQFLANLRESGTAGLEDRFAYLMPSLRRAPRGIVGVFVGWERLMSVLAGAPSAAALQVFPRLGGTSGPVLPWSEREGDH